MRRRQTRHPKQLLPISPSTVRTLIAPALLQHRNHQRNKILQTLRHHSARQIKSVNIGFLNPRDQPIGKPAPGRQQSATCRLPNTNRSIRSRLVQPGPIARAIASTFDRIACKRAPSIGSSIPNRAKSMPQRSRGMRQRFLERRATWAILGEFSPASRSGHLYHDRCATEHLQRPRRGARRSGNQARHVGLAAAVHEHTLRGPGGKAAPAIRRAGLIQHQRSLRRQLSAEMRIASSRVIAALVAARSTHRAGSA